MQAVCRRFWTQSPAWSSRPSAGNVPAEKVGDAVRFDHVSLTYKGAGAPSLSDISFTAKRGQTIGVIGGTGSGKSSLISLIPRFYDATEGSVEIMGRPVRQYPRADLRGKVGCGHAEGASSSAAPSAPTCSGAARMPPTPTSGLRWKRHRLRSS